MWLSTNAKVYYYHTDQVGTVRAITDQSGKVIFSADYFAFGAKFVSNGDFDETHGFTGKEYDSDTGLYYYNARWYDPDLGRFISEDPAADPNNPNLYSYCGNNGVVRTDPTGQVFILDDFLIAVAIAAAAGAVYSACNGGNPLIGAFVGAVSGAVGYCCGAMFGTYLAGSLQAIAVAAASGALSGGIMSALMGGDFWEGARTGAISGGVSNWLSSLIPVTNYKGQTAENIFINGARKKLISGFSGLAATGKLNFQLSTDDFITAVWPALMSIKNPALPIDQNKIDQAKDLMNGKTTDHGNVMAVAKEVGLNKAELLRLCGELALDEQRYCPHDGLTRCNELAGEVYYLFTGKRDLQVPYKNVAGQYKFMTDEQNKKTWAEGKHFTNENSVIAQELANRGVFVVALTTSVNPDTPNATEHIAVIMPGSGETKNKVFYPSIVQQGGHGFMVGYRADENVITNQYSNNAETLNWGWGSDKQKDIVYFANFPR